MTDLLRQRIEAMRGQLKHGATALAVPQLVPTPPELALEMVDVLAPRRGERILEPSAGTGRLLDALPVGLGLEVTAVELHTELAPRLATRWPGARVVCDDFLGCERLGTFDGVLMNPPFRHGADIGHIRHAYRFLRPGGRLVALCADGPRQREGLKVWVVGRGGAWRPLGQAFEAEGVRVRAVMLSVRKEGGHG